MASLREWLRTDGRLRMTEYEYATLFFQVSETAHAAIANFLTVVFAMIVVSYLTAHKLDRYATGLLLTAYSLFSLGLSFEIFNLYRDFGELGWELAQYHDANPTAYAWLGMATDTENGPNRIIPAVIAAVCVIAYLGSMLFFIRMRRIKRVGIEDS
jgi:xanthine/uracil permease